MNVLDVIVAKRDGRELTPEQIDWFISTYAAGEEIADEQAASLAMAIFLNGMVPDELSRWTQAMIDSGATLDLSEVGRPTVDKHSTGGVGDKISLILVPLLVACGAAVPQISGRGLGHTGGTLDKMESISGWRADLTVAELRHQVATIGGIIASATGDLAPADRRLYALRDVTGTVESIPLIASSIMSKKIAEGTDALTLDVKAGAGAFMSDVESATELARTMVRLGTDQGVATSALVTRMDDVLGRAVGNAVEVTESLEVLAGGGPSDVIELTIALADDMVRLTGLDADPASLLASGAALAVFEEMVEAQGGDLGAGLPVAEHKSHIKATSSGFVSAVRSRPIGNAAWRLGAGRARKEDPVSATAGVICLVAPGHEVEAGQPVLELHADRPALLEEVTPMLDGAVQIDDEPRPRPPIVIERISADSL